MNNNRKYEVDRKIRELESRVDSKKDSAEQNIEAVISKYIKSGQLEDAQKIISENELSEYWCHKAVAVYVLSGKDVLAREVIEWAKQNSNKLYIWRRCIHEYARTQWKLICGYDPEGVVVLPGLVGQEEKKGIKEIIEVMQPVLLHIEGDACVSSELEANILWIAINAFWLIGDTEKARKLASYLQTKQPASIGLANLAMLGLVGEGELSSEFIDRLHTDHPDSFNAKMLSQLLKANFLGQSKEAFESLKAFAPTVKKENSLRYCQGLFQVAQILGQAAIEECIKLSENLLGRDNSFCRLVYAEFLLNSNNLVEAEKIAEKYKNEGDPQWLQINAIIQEQKGNYEEAISDYEKASKLMSSPEVFAAMGRLATQATEKDDKFISSVIDAYKSLLNLKPDDISARHNLAFALARSSKLQEAKEHFKYLSEHSTEIVYKQNYANCLANTDEPKKALKIYDEICEADDVPVEAVVAKTELLKQVKNPFVAFDFLQKFRERFWDIPSYLQCYVKVSSQANQDGLMHEAFMQLRQLQSQGIVSPEIIQEKKLDDLIEYSKRWNERTRQIHDSYLKGEMPWGLADDLLNHPLYTGWLIRTQKRSWVSEEPVVTASCSIYSTNNFHPLKSDDGKVYLQKLECIPPDSEVIIDVSALITLHRLGLLDKVKDYFKKIYVPTLYQSELLKDSEELIFHQYSNVEAICEVKKAIDNGTIEVIKDFGKPNERPFAFINEHTFPEKDEEHYYRLIDLLDVLESNGLVRKGKMADVKKISLNQSAIDEQHPPVNKNDKIIIELSTLKTIINFGLYSSVADNFEIALSPESHGQVLSEYSTIEHQKRLQDWNKDLHCILLSNDFEKVDINIDAKNKGDFSLAAMMLSTQKNLPLYSDDRVIQVAVLNDKSQNVSFGTDAFANALYSQGSLSKVELTNIYLQLIDWRYKFVIPPIDVLTYLAEQYSNKPPGSELNSIALYAHSCMCDPGLLCGPEKTADIPLPIAVKIYTEWFLLATNFIIKCWTNKDFDDAISDKFTDWTMLNLFPTIPKYVPDGGYRLASMTKKIVLGDAITKLITVGDIDVGNKVLLLLKEKLDLSDIEYNRVVSETIDAI